MYFYGGGTFLRRRRISLAEAYFYGGGTFLLFLISIIKSAEHEVNYSRRSGMYQS